MENCNKATWKNNTFYDLDHILSKRKNSATNPDEGIYYAGITFKISGGIISEIYLWGFDIDDD